jgi:hypothetical protein
MAFNPNWSHIVLQQIKEMINALALLFAYNKSPYYSAMLDVNFVYVTPLFNKVGRRTTAAIDRD